MCECANVSRMCGDTQSCLPPSAGPGLHRGRDVGAGLRDQAAGRLREHASFTARSQVPGVGKCQTGRSRSSTPGATALHAMWTVRVPPTHCTRGSFLLPWPPMQVCEVGCWQERSVRCTLCIGPERFCLLGLLGSAAAASQHRATSRLILPGAWAMHCIPPSPCVTAFPAPAPVSLPSSPEVSLTVLPPSLPPHCLPCAARVWRPPGRVPLR